MNLLRLRRGPNSNWIGVLLDGFRIIEGDASLPEGLKGGNATGIGVAFHDKISFRRIAGHIHRLVIFGARVRNKIHVVGRIG